MLVPILSEILNEGPECEIRGTFMPNEGNAYYGLGNALLELNSKDEALTAYKQASKFLMIEGEYEKAVDACEKALSIKHDDVEPLVNKAKALSALKRNEEAVKAYDDVLEIIPEEPQIWYFRGVALKKLKRVVGSVSSFEKAAILWENMGKKNEALQAYESLLSIKKCDFITLSKKADLLLSLKKKNFALEDYRRAVDLALKQEAHKQALDICEKGIKIEPKNYDLWLKRSEIYKKLNREKDASWALSRAKELSAEKRYESANWYDNGHPINRFGLYK